MRIAGSCHCGIIAIALTFNPPPVKLPARVCTCEFCSKHGGVWTASPSATLQIAIKDPAKVNCYTFATRTAQFHICKDCGVVPFATSTIRGREYAVVNVNTLEDLPENLLNRAPVSFDGEGMGERLERREKHWISKIQYV